MVASFSSFKTNNKKISEILKDCGRVEIECVINHVGVSEMHEVSYLLNPNLHDWCMG